MDMKWDIILTLLISCVSIFVKIDAPERDKSEFVRRDG